VTGGDEGAGNPPPFPLAIIDAKPGTSEAEYRRDVEWVDALVTSYRKLRDVLADYSTATGPSHLKKGATVLALVPFFLAVGLPPASRALVLDLFPPQAAKLVNDSIRGMIAAAVGLLRATPMENPQIERWLDEEIKRRTLDFRGADAVRWFRDCNTGTVSVPRGTLDAFQFLCPEPLQSLTEAVAKERVVQMLDTAVVMKAGPLKTKPRRHR
jgi:hypothetical protein